MRQYIHVVSQHLDISVQKDMDSKTMSYYHELAHLEILMMKYTLHNL